MKRHFVGAVDESRFSTPELFAQHSAGYRRLELVDHTTSPAAVHLGLSLVEVAAGGYLKPVMHAFEKGYYILDGSVIIGVDGRAHQLHKDYYGVFPKATSYSYFNAGDEPVRILEVMAPQPKPAESGFHDTLFDSAAELARSARTPDLSDPRIRRIGRFDESQLPDAGQISGTGVRS
ncbi:MAG TPA: cupin domain-containing protein, partial [Gammaproteobacteria bacterium]|nr:cupin domain-containing protein [Gammaproteobacteria bacterium]